MSKSINAPHLSRSYAFFTPSAVQGFTSQCDTFGVVRDGVFVGNFKNGNGRVPGVDGVFAHGQRVN